MEKRSRSPDYPSLPLAEAIDRLKKLHSAVKRNPAPRDVIAKGMGYNSLNGASASAIGALNKYGLLERASPEEIRISERGMMILHPHNLAEQQSAIRAAAMEPKLFTEILGRFEDGSPSDDLLRNFLIRQGFVAGSVETAIQSFRETMNLVNVSPANSELSLPLSRADGLGKVPMQISSASRQSEPIMTYVPDPNADERSLGRYDFEGGGHVRIVAGGDIETEDALEMAETLIRLKRAELQKARRRVGAHSDAPGHDDHQSSGDTEELQK